ncbi:MAG: 50S ribosome-binding GTPase, partial [Myxococcales bacterium]|nr:50S ribosome-binding GTPase [Myxococcales bacterium]
MTTHPQELAERIEQSARRLFGTTELATQLALEADRYQRDAAAILTRRGVKRATLAFTGPTGHGKTSLLRMLVRSEEARERLAAGVRGADRTAQVVWVGPQRPDDLDPKHEAHVLCRGDELEDLGRPVALVDTPGFSNRHGSLARIAVDALTDADLHVLVVRRDQIERADVLQHGEHAVG